MMAGGAAGREPPLGDADLVIVDLNVGCRSDSHGNSFRAWSMIPKSGNRFSDKIMLNQKIKAGVRSNCVASDSSRRRPKCPRTEFFTDILVENFRPNIRGFEESYRLFPLPILLLAGGIVHYSAC
jgi:hypothetical protein